MPGLCATTLPLRIAGMEACKFVEKKTHRQGALNIHPYPFMGFVERSDKERTGSFQGCRKCTNTSHSGKSSVSTVISLL